MLPAGPKDSLEQLTGTIHQSLNFDAAYECHTPGIKKETVILQKLLSLIRN
jgi:hypothetical protein